MSSGRPGSSARRAAAVLLAGLLTALAALTACTGDDGAGAESDPSSAAATRTPSPSSADSAEAPSPASTPTATPMDGVSDADDDDQGDHGDEGHGDVVPAAGADPAAAAVLVLQTWARPRLSYDQWWAQLRPMLSISAQQDYAATDPSLIPALEVLDQTPTVVGERDVWARVAVATTEGRFEVELTRSAVSAERQGGWQAARIYFPQS